MAGRMPGCCNDRDAAVAEYVEVAGELGHRMLRLEASAAGRARPFVFCLLHQQHGLREQLDIADMVRMRMRDGDEFDVGRLDAELIELARKRLRASPADGLRIGWSLPVRHGGNHVGDPGVPEQPTLRV